MLRTPSNTRFQRNFLTHTLTFVIVHLLFLKYCKVLQMAYKRVLAHFQHFLYLRPRSHWDVRIRMQVDTIRCDTMRYDPNPLGTHRSGSDPDASRFDTSHLGRWFPSGSNPLSRNQSPVGTLSASYRIGLNRVNVINIRVFAIFV